MNTTRLRKLLFVLTLTGTLAAQSNTGELRLKMVDQSGSAITGSVELVSEVNAVHEKLDTDSDGSLVVKRLPFGLYNLHVEHSGFNPYSELVEIRSALPLERTITLGVAAIETVVTVTDSATLLDPHTTGDVNRLGAEALEDRSSSRPGRTLLDLVDSQPGWLLEANGVLHPRGSEYQTQYVIDGIPLTENRSPAFSPEMDPEGVESMSVLTGGYPAEYGRKLGGVIEVNTSKDITPGFHGTASVYGESFATAGGDLVGQYGWGHNTFSLGASADRTGRFLDPPVEQNYTNSGTNAGFSAHYERDLTDHDRLGMVLRWGHSRFQVPNEQVQQAAGQREDRGNGETAGQISYQHVFSSNMVGDLRAMVRDISATLWSNPLSTPVVASQERGLRESYVNGSISIHRGHNEYKAGMEADFGSIRERFAYALADPTQFDPDTPLSFQFANRAQDREQALFAQDLLRLGNWTLSAGLRWDHYHVVAEQNAVSPRLGAAWFWKPAGIVFRASYDRVFQTPAFENLLLSSSPAIDSLNDNVLRLAVKPSLGNFYEAGFARVFFGRVKLDADYYHRNVNNYADDDVLLNTGVSFPISFNRASTYGTEVKLEVSRWGRFSGFLSYSNMRGVGYFPVTGGLFLGNDASGLLSNTTSFPVTQDQRNTVRGRLRYEFTSRVWAAFESAYGSGLPVEFDGTYQDALAQYGQRIVNQVNFERGRVRPNFTISASAGAILWQHEKRSLRAQGDIENLTNRLNVIDFAGLFSGTALAAPRSGAARLKFEF